MLDKETTRQLREVFREEIEKQIAKLRAVPGRCETCPDGPCEYCELRGCLALRRRLEQNAARDAEQEAV